MKTLYLECGMGAAGDMLMAALLELLTEQERISFLETMNHLMDGVTVTAEQMETCGIVGTHMHVTVHGQEEHSHDLHAHTHEHTHEHTHDHDHDHDHEHTHEHEHDHDHEHTHDHTHEHSHGHHHASMHDITHIIRDHMTLPEAVREHALAVYESIAEAEARAHGKPVEEIHFHEVGTLDAVTDVVGVCLLMDMLHPDQVLASPVHVGSGYVHCAHGVLPVPAPATATLLEGIPSYGGEVEGELCTPTGAALLRHFVSDFGNRPVMTIEKTGYGIGTKKFPRANCLRAMLGRTEEAAGQENICELSCNIDDMTSEDLAYGMEVLRNHGALEVYTVAANMKKGRPGVVLFCVCHETERDALAALMFRHFSTLGIRVNSMTRYVLDRELETRQTALGPVRCKRSSGWGCTKEKAEFEDLRAIAEQTGLSLREIREKL